MKDTGSIRRRCMTVVLGVIVMTGCGEANKADTDPAATEPVATLQAGGDPIAKGQALYQKYCASCHGPEARGDGPLASMLKVPPPDLTRLTERYGTYPVDLVYQTIDGREMVQGHGTREMPVWGNVWTDKEGGADAETRINRQINELVEYLRTLQVRGEE